MGIGGKALEMIYKHAAKEMNMIKVYGEVYEMNSTCKKCCISVDLFVKEN